MAVSGRNFITMFDFTPNAPRDPNGAALEARSMRNPLDDIARAEQMIEAMRPIESRPARGWRGGRQAPAMTRTCCELHRDPPAAEGFGDVVAASCSEAYWNR